LTGQFKTYREVTGMIFVLILQLDGPITKLLTWRHRSRRRSTCYRVRDIVFGGCFVQR